MRHRLPMVLLALGTAAAPSPIWAQQQTPGQTPQATQPAPPGDTTLAAQLTTEITTDTAAFIPGHTDFRRYTTPLSCLVAARHALTLERRSIAAQEMADTMRRHAARDTLPAGVARVTQACAAQFPVATTPAADLPHLFDLALLEEQDALAAAVLTRLLALAASPSAKAAVLLDAVQTYLAASPARVATADTLVARLDALGDGAAVLPSRIAAHVQLAQFGDSMADGARVRREVAQVLTLARALLATGPHMGAAETLVQAYRLLSRYVYIHAPDSLQVFAQQLQQDVQRFPDLKRYATLSLDSMVTQLSPVGLWHVVGQPTPPLRADFWFPARAADTGAVQPMPGRVSLFVEVPPRCYDSYINQSVLNPIGSGCQRLYTFVRQLRAQYAGLDLTLVALAADHGGTVLSGPQPAAAAAQNLRWFFLQYLKLPINRLAVQIVQTMAPLPEPDGRIFVLAPDTTKTAPFAKISNWWGALDNNGWSTPFQRLYHPTADVDGSSAHMVLTGRDGMYLYGGAPSVVFDQLLARVMAASTTPATPTASPAAPAIGPAQSAPTASAHP